MQKQGIKTMQTAAFLIAAAIALGAFAKHGLTNKVGEREIEIFETAARYQMYNAIGLLLLGLTHAQYNLRNFKLVSSLIYAGIFVFCVSLYVMGSAPLFTDANVRILGAITPIGGICMISGWLLAAFSLGKLNKHS